MPRAPLSRCPALSTDCCGCCWHTPQRILSRDQLLQLTQGRDADVFDRSIDLLVSRLRQRLRDGSREPRYIKTVRNEGYVFCVPLRTEAQG